VVESLTEELLRRRAPVSAVRRERRILFDGVRADIHPFDVTVETAARAEAYDCKWGARGINAEVLLQLGEARTHAEAEEAQLLITIVVFDARRSCRTRLARLSASGSGTRLVSIETLDRLAGATSKPIPPAPALS
jgi:hypothetical protein